MSALLDIATAGLAVEEAIARHAGELDAAAVRLLERRLEAARRCAQASNPRPLLLPVAVLAPHADTAWLCVAQQCNLATSWHMQALPGPGSGKRLGRIHPHALLATDPEVLATCESLIASIVGLLCGWC